MGRQLQKNLQTSLISHFLFSMSWESREMLGGVGYNRDLVRGTATVAVKAYQEL